MKISLLFTVISFLITYYMYFTGREFGTGVGFACGLMWLGVWLCEMAGEKGWL